MIKGQFQPLAELWIPPLLKLLQIKIQVILSAADRCVRTIMISGAPNGYFRVLQILLENLSSKSGTIRKYCFEYITLAAISWDSDSAFDRFLLYFLLILFILFL